MSIQGNVSVLETRTPCLRVIAEHGLDALTRATKLPLERTLHLEVLDPLCQLHRLRVPALSAKTPLVDHTRGADRLGDQPREKLVVQRGADEGAFEDGVRMQAGLFVLLVA